MNTTPMNNMGGDPSVISLDIETYGACLRSKSGQLLPEQTVFNPIRSLHTDKVTREDLILTVAITIPTCDPRWNNSSSLTNSKHSPNSHICTTTTSSTLDSTSSTMHSPNSPTKIPWSSSLIAELLPETTMVFQMSQASHRECLRQWLLYSDTILGMNIQFDIQYLRQLRDFKYVLNGSHTLIDLSVVNYLHSELRPEKSLKSLGPILGTHSYKETIKNQRFSSPEDTKLISYNAQDTHNTLVCIAELASRINDECKPLSQIYMKTPSTTSNSSSNLMTEMKSLSIRRTSSPPSEVPLRPATTGLKESKRKTTSLATLNQVRSTSLNSTSPSLPSSSPKFSPQTNDKLSSSCITHYSDTIWTCIRMSEAGIPFNLGDLQKLYDILKRKCAIASKLSQSKWDLVLEGKGSAKSKDEFINQLTLATCKNHPNILDELNLTPKTKKVSWSENNRNLFASYLPPSHPLQAALRVVKYHASSQKLISTYIFPLLHHKRNKPNDKSSVLIPLNKDISLAHPTWYIVPSFLKESTKEGGTIQGRITCKNPASQTFPPSIKNRMKSRWKNGKILSFDLSQIELRVAALLSGDKKLLASYNEGLDLHTNRTISIFGQDIINSTDFKSKWRQIGKTLNFADLFLASAYRMQRTVVEMCGELLPLDFFKNIVKTRYDERPELTEWQYHLCCVAEKEGLLILPHTGQSRTFTAFQVDHNKWKQSRIPSPIYSTLNKSQINEIVNFPIQTTASNVLLHIQHKLNQTLPCINAVKPRPLMFLQIYDSVFFDCPSNQIEILTQKIQQAVNYVDSYCGYWGNLQQQCNRSVPLLYEVDILT